MLYKRNQLIDSSHQELSLLNTLLIQLVLNSFHISLINTSNTSLDCIECDPQVVKSLLSEALVLCKGCNHLRGHYTYDGLQEVKETNVVVFICVQKLHVVDNFEVDILICEVKQLTSE